MQGGFGQPPGGGNGGGFGQPPQGGFGTPPPQQGGFGGNTPPPQGGFGGNTPPPQGGFGAPPQQGGFGGNTPPPQGGFGAPPQGGFGAPPQGGFGQTGGAQHSGFGPPPAGGPSVGAPPPPPMAGGQPPSGGEPPNNIGLILAGLWLAAGMLGCLGTGVGAAMLSESDAVVISYLGLPLFAGGASAMIIAPFLRTKGAPAAIGAPLGCGCVGFLFAMVSIVVFYQAIWPSL